MPSALASLTRGGAALGLLVLALALVAVGRWWERATAPVPDQVQVTMAKRPMRLSDVAEGTRPDQRREYQAPDSSDTRTDCITLPSWLDSLQTRSTTDSSTTQRQRSEQRNQDGAASGDGGSQGGSADDSYAAPTVSRGPSYVITPTTNGRPALSVTSQTVTRSAIDPRDGSGLEYTYEIPRDRNRLAAYADTYVLPNIAGTTIGARYERRLEWGRLSVAPGYAVMSEGRGPAVTVSLSTGLSW